MSLCPDAVAKLLACCNATVACQTLYMSTTEAEFNTRLMAVGTWQSNIIGGSALSNLLGLLLRLACDDDCNNAAALLQVMDPCEHGFVLSTTSLSCQRFGQEAPFFNDAGSLFFTAIFLCVAIMVLVCMASILWKLRGRRL
jgi:hypothetical protein